MSDGNEKDIESYRRDLLECDNNSIGEYDKAVMTLSGGAIGLTFAFLKDVGTLQHIIFLLAAWTFWGISITCVVFSHYFSHLAMRHALKSLNDKKLIYHKPGGCWDTAINILNPVAGGLFLAGLVSLLFFVSYNVKSENHAEQSHTRSTVVTTTTTTSTEEIDGRNNVTQTNTNVLTSQLK
jgi:hypothetical protein